MILIKETKNIKTFDIVLFVKMYSENHSSNYTRLIFNSIVSYLKCKRKFDIIDECRNIRMPSIIHYNKLTITFEETEQIKQIIER